MSAVRDSCGAAGGHGGVGDCFRVLGLETDADDVGECGNMEED